MNKCRNLKGLNRKCLCGHRAVQLGSTSHKLMNTVMECFISMASALHAVCIFFIQRNYSEIFGSFRQCTLHIHPAQSVTLYQNSPTSLQFIPPTSSTSYSLGFRETIAPILLSMLEAKKLLCLVIDFRYLFASSTPSLSFSSQNKFHLKNSIFWVDRKWSCYRKPWRCSYS